MNGVNKNLSHIDPFTNIKAIRIKVFQIETANRSLFRGYEQLCYIMTFQYITDILQIF